MLKGIERRPPVVHEHAKREQWRAANPMLTVDQYLAALIEPIANEGDAAVETVDPQRIHVGRRKVQEVDSPDPEPLRVVTILLTKVDDGRDAMYVG
jgi:hypothetical protein